MSEKALLKENVVGVCLIRGSGAARSCRHWLLNVFVRPERTTSELEGTAAALIDTSWSWTRYGGSLVGRCCCC